MSNYFYDMIPQEELDIIAYVPTMPEFIAKIAKYGDKPAVTEGDRTLTYTELTHEIALRRDYIESLGLPKGSNIGIFDRNSLNAIELFYAITSAGYVAMFIPAGLPAPAIQGIAMKFQLKAIFVRDEFAALAEGLPIKVCPASATGTKEAPCADGIQKADPCAIYFTGGSTGAPKGVVLSHGAYLRGTFNGTFSPGPQVACHTTIAILPFSHVFGSIRGLGSVLNAGCLLYTCEDMKATIGRIPFIKPTVLTLVPGLAEMLLGIAKMRGIEFLGGRLKTIICGAANVPPRAIKAYNEIGISLLGGYGLTESANLVSGNADVLTHPTSVGKIYPGIETKVVDGELWIKGDNVCSGYYNNPEATAAAFEGEWFKTGDLVRFDEDGYLYITGRIKNLIILSNGENVSPEEIEEHFYKLPYIKDVLVREEQEGEDGVIAIHMLPLMPAFDGKSQEEIEAAMKAAVEQVNATLPSTHRVQKIHVRFEDFPRTGAMKIDRNKLPR